MQLDYGEKNINIPFPVENIDCTVTSRAADILPESSIPEQVSHALEHPIGCSRLEERIHPNERVCILVSDVTRLWQCTAEYMPMLVNRINACGVPDENTLIIVAVGTHRSQTPEEFERIVGSEVVRRVRVINHDCDDMEHLRCVGQTPSGNEVYLNSYALDCVRLILTGGTVLHFLAGFGGGAKSIIPGIASRDTVNYNHNLALNQGFGSGIHPLVRSGSMDGNPLREDIDAGAALISIDFMINVVANERGQIVRVFAGDVFQAHRKAAEYIREMYTVPVKRRVPLLFVSGGGFPKDINLRQTAKSLHCALSMAEESSTIILAAECRDGFGDEQIRRQIMDFSDMRERELDLRSHFTIGAFVGFYFTEVAEKHHVILITSMPAEWFRNTKIHVSATAEEALRLAEQLNGGNRRHARGAFARRRKCAAGGGVRGPIMCKT